MKVKKSFIHNANKKTTDNFGNAKIYAIVETLNNCGFHCEVEPKIHDVRFSTKNKIRNPDIVIKFGGMVLILESDGKVHGNLEMPTKSTIQRNTDFENTFRNYILINHEHIRELKKILCIVANDEDLANFIAAYRACEEYSKSISKKQAKPIILWTPKINEKNQ
jgi:hypothetical protein